MVRWHARARDYLVSHRAGAYEGTLESILHGLAARLDTQDCFVIFTDRAAPEAYVQLTDELCEVDSRVLSEAQQLVLKKMGFHSPEDSAGGNFWQDTQDLDFEALAALVEQALVVLGSEPGFTVSVELPLPAPAPVRSASGGEPREELAWFTPAMEARRTKRWADVEALTRERLSNSSDHGFAHEVLAEALEKQGKIDEAIVRYEQAIASATGPRRNAWLKPRAQPFKKLDILYQRLHKYDESLRVCKSYVVYHEYSADAWNRLRRAADWLGLIELAAQAKAKYEHLK
jgi:tetratricopeptide (TPR) repeat protein